MVNQAPTLVNRARVQQALQATPKPAPGVPARTTTTTTTTTTTSFARATSTQVPQASTFGRAFGEATGTIPRRIHGNSLDYVGPTHVYKIIKDGVVQKIGESTKGFNSFGLSKRAEKQARKLNRTNDGYYKTEIIKHFDNKRAAKAYETELIKAAREADPHALPLNKNNH